jgi:multidrug efflux system membrane fusion protein
MPHGCAPPAWLRTKPYCRWPVSVATVAESDVAAWDEFSGRLEAVERVDVRSRVAGAVQAVHFREGALVQKGDLLVTIDPAPYAAEAERAEAQVAAAQARVTHATRATPAPSACGKTARSRSANWTKRAANAMRAKPRPTCAPRRRNCQAARLNLGYTQVRAPVAGRIGKLEVTVGNLVAAGPGAPVLTTLVSVSPIYASFEADEQVVARAADLPAAPAPAQLIERIPVQMGTAASADTPLPASCS